MATKTNLVALSNSTLLVTGDAPLTLDAAELLVGRTVEMPTLHANEVADYTIESVSRNRETGELTAWMVRAGKRGGHHARFVTKGS